MLKYVMVYDQPYEYDDDSPSGVGDHVVRFQKNTVSFGAVNDKAAKRTVIKHLGQGGLEFDLHPGSVSPGLYPRKFISLREVVDPREITMVKELRDAKA